MYDDFIRRHADDCLVIVVYVAEAHFIEREGGQKGTGRIVDGWPRGYPLKYEFPQHKTMVDRINMAITTYQSVEMPFFRSCAAVLCDTMNNDFLIFFGGWPDAAFAIDAKQETLLYRGIFDGATMSGLRVSNFAHQIDRFLLEAKETPIA